MSELTITGFARNTDDFKGKEQPEVYYVVMNGREKALGKAALLDAIRMNLPDRTDGEEPSRPFERVNGA